MNRIFLLAALASTAAATSLFAGSRSSANYTIVTEGFDSGGTSVSSANYSVKGSSTGMIGGVATGGNPLITNKSGYVGQLYDPIGLVLSATPTTVNEGTTRQLSVIVQLDDLSTLALASNAPAWNVVSGPITSVSASGVATAAIVYQDTGATVSATYQGNSGQLGLTVVNVNNDDFGTYAGDGIDDAWQVQYFGIGNPNAGPNMDPDGDGVTNLFEYVAGTNPTDPNSKFSLLVSPVVGQPGQKKLDFSPRFPDRTYVVESIPTLITGGGAGVWTPLSGSTTSDNGVLRTVIDTGAAGPDRFYHVKITKP